MATIVVVGGGLAGLACGWRLARQGHAVRVLERADDIGGRARSVRRGDWLLETGCPGVVPGQRRLLALAQECGVLGALRPWAFGRDWRWRRGALVPCSRRDLLERWEPAAARRALRTALDFQRPGRRFDLAQGGAHAASDAAALRAAAADALAWWPIAPSPWQAPGHAGLRASQPLLAPHAFLGGMSVLAHALARPLDVRTGCDVVKVETDSEGASVAYRVGGGERRERVDAVVVALPAPRVAPVCPKLTPEERGFFERARAEPGVVVHLWGPNAPDPGLRSVWLGPDGGSELAALLAEHVRVGAGPLGGGLLRAVLSPRAASRMFRASDASIADLALENLAYSPVAARWGDWRPEGFAVWRHADAAPRFDARHARRLARFVRRLERSPRLAFAGDFLAGPSSDAAVASGLQAAREIARSL